MKFFSFFDKKQQCQNDTEVEDARASREKNMHANSRSVHNPSTLSDQRSAARATELKIDAIESAMTLHLDLDPRLTGIVTASAIPIRRDASAAFQRPMQIAEASTEILFDDAPRSNTIALWETLPTPVIEEAAILFANNQAGLAERLLQNAILKAPPTIHVEHAYLLLFDLYRISGQQQAFDSLTIDYIDSFGASPPVWRNSSRQASNQATVFFPAVLAGNCAPQIALAQQLRAVSHVLQLDFSNIREVDPTGCALLLQLLQSLHKSGHDLILPGTPGLIVHLQSTLHVGQRDGGSAPWLLLLELLQFLNREQEFEESSIEYCITFEISPPAFEVPCIQVTLAPRQKILAVSQTERFVMPDIVTGDTRQLIEAIIAFAAERDTVVIDCSQLNCIDFSASAKLLTGLVPLAGNDKIIEFDQVNYLVAALLNVMGLKEIARIIARKD